ncbi:hypothetical protein [Streptomyces sp. NBC_01306]|uniref:hypothetical protein n=1 Tax=Streptomyces sp. NBC_01306 TaxID=2903819 RepID=UPI00225BA37C|nr:hypothetical protein [Streptomyces sp. NBC_01306]MCX4723836.1 hypothetical protein [Streptomyces sp. NBC_01306]
MYESDAFIAKRYGDSRPGLNLVAVADAALPVTQLNVDVLAQERKAIPLLDEFVIRLVSNGVRDPEEIANILGLDLKLAESAIVEQLAADNLARAAGQKTRVELTPQGRLMAVELEAVRPVHRLLPVTFDRLTWGVASYRPEFLVPKKEAEEAGLVVLPAIRSQRIVPADVTVASLNRLISDGAENRRNLEVLAVEKMAPKKHRYLPVKLLVFSDDPRTEIQLGVVVDGQLSAPHERALLSSGGPSALNITVGEPASRPLLPADLEAIRTRQQRPSSDNSTSPPVDSLAKQKESSIEVRDVSVHEHPDFLRESLAGSKQRLLIVAPWIKNSIVDTTFISSLERLLRRGVKIHIAYGIGEDDRDSHERAISRLRNLGGRYKESFTFIRLKNSHAKILISDDIWINTSFNWLSFKGDPNRTYRMEEGILVRGSKRVNEAYEKYLRMLEEQKA